MARCASRLLTVPDASVCCATLARPPFALDRLRELDREHLIYDHPKPGPGGNGPQLLTPLELLDRLVALVPPPRFHRHRSSCGNEAPQHSRIGCLQEEAKIEPARGPSLWETADAEHDSTPDPALPPTLANGFDQRIAW
jgi:hypothetical protein